MNGSRGRATPPKRQGSRIRVRFGGECTPSGYLFELTGGHPCLDLANTRDRRRTATPQELLTSYDDLLAWGRQAGTVTAREVTVLAAHARAQGARATRILAHVRSLREAIFAIFSAVARKAVPPDRCVAALNQALAEVLPARHLRQGGLAWAWAWRAARPPDLGRVIWPALVSAAELLTSEDRLRVRECAGEGCAWLFLDRSRSQTRRWCDMTVCGNRSKVRRHRARRSRGSRASDR
jgi:predicted RNA-binding Zn ribbon-like protein